jgi:glycosyltransferase involved in cell wall biosynthesis
MVMNVVHIITGLDAGGAEGVLYRLCLADTGGRHRHAVISLTVRGTHAAALERAGIRVVDLGINSFLSAITGVWRLRKLLKILKPDVVQTWMYHADLIGGIAARLAGIRSVVWGIRNTAPVEPVMKLSTRLVINACARFSRFVPMRIVVCAVNSIDAHSDIGYQREKMVVIQNGIDETQFYREDAKRSRWRNDARLHPHELLLGMVARHSPQKDHRNLLEALKILTERGTAFRCVLVGSGMDENNNEAVSWIEVSGLSEHVTLMGMRTDVADVMRALDVHILSSRIEGFPNVLAEAMACGTPCVSTDVGDAEYIVGDHGWLVPKGDPIALADAISEALSELQGSPERWQQRRSDCENHIRENFGLQRMVDEFSATWAAVAQVR